MKCPQGVFVCAVPSETFSGTSKQDKECYGVKIGKEGENNNGKGRRETQTKLQTERERAIKERINQCGRLSSLYTVHHVTLI